MSKKMDTTFIKNILQTKKDDLARKFLYILSTEQKKSVIKEVGYFSTVYDEDFDVILGAVINKYIKQRLYDVSYSKLPQDYRDYITIKKLEYDYKKLTGKNIHDDREVIQLK